MTVMKSYVGKDLKIKTKEHICIMHIIVKYTVKTAPALAMF